MNTVDRFFISECVNNVNTELYGKLMDEKVIYN